MKRRHALTCISSQNQGATKIRLSQRSSAPSRSPLVPGGTLLPTLLAWRLDTLARRRAKLNLCPKCGYDRTGLVGGEDAKCPECGSVAAVSGSSKV